ncbi:polymer-forming cytoskeletal protein [Patescibacteria group bacterium AH-259-L07]|nr:polymer-forming cytoskeletal protein [Patescibacteria group bacterium AH-259-L07]
MLGKEGKIKPEDAETIIGAGVKVEGTFAAFGNVIIKGQLLGSLETKSRLELREGGRIEADITAKNASVGGEVKGNLDVEEKIELASTAKVSGDLTCRVLAIEEGAVLNGRCSVGSDAASSVIQEEREEERKERKKE